MDLNDAYYCYNPIFVYQPIDSTIPCDMRSSCKGLLHGTGTSPLQRICFV